jgi:hypothetical protein
MTHGEEVSAMTSTRSFIALLTALVLAAAPALALTELSGGLVGEPTLTASEPGGGGGGP